MTIELIRGNVRVSAKVILFAIAIGAPSSVAAQNSTLQYESITEAELREGAAQHKNVVGSLPGDDHGHVVLQSNKPGRVWDGNSVVRLKESLDRIKAGNETLSDDPKEQNRRQKLLTDVLNPGRYRTYLNGKIDLLRIDDLRALTAKLDTEKLLAVYSAEGNRVQLSYYGPDQARVKWFRSSQPLDIRYSREIFEQVKRAAQGSEGPLACNQLIQKILKDDRLQGATANQIYEIITKDAKETADRQRRESREPAREIDYRGDKDKPVIGKPGGTILSAIAHVDGLSPADIQLVTFDRNASRLDLRTKAATIHSFIVDPDDLAVVIRSIYFKNADPVLSMGFDSNKPGYYSVEYSGALYRTHVGKVLFEADSTLGKLIFNADSDEHAIVSDLLPRYEQKVKHGNLLARSGRTYLMPASVRLRVAGNELKEEKVDLTIAVETAGLGAWYVQRQLAELAQYLNANMDILRESFESFQSFQDLSALTGLIKWLHESSIAVDFDWVRDYTPREEIFPSYIPADSWRFLYTGGSLDGWLQTVSLGGGTPWQTINGAISVTTTDSASERLYFEHWGTDYDVEFLIHVDGGKADFVLRMDAAGKPVLLSLPTEQSFLARVKFTKGDWSLYIDGKEKISGHVSVPQEEPSSEEAFGFLAAPNSIIRITSVRYRQPY